MRHDSAVQEIDRVYRSDSSGEFVAYAGPGERWNDQDHDWTEALVFVGLGNEGNRAKWIIVASDDETYLGDLIETDMTLSVVAP